MASVSLVDLYVHLAADPTQYLRLGVDTEDEGTDLDGEVRALVSGRVRAVVGSAVQNGLQFKCSLIDRNTYNALRQWIREGRFFMVRDPRGRVLWGHIFSLPASEVQAGDLVNLSIDFKAVTYSEEV